MKLKTLKDLERKANPDFVYSKELKTEAIKWVKEFKKRKMKMCGFDFKRFFNITEKDLK